jgi:hypothetical protein
MRESDWEPLIIREQRDELLCREMPRGDDE